jgi:hypothetical protein
MVQTTWAKFALEEGLCLLLTDASFDLRTRYGAPEVAEAHMLSSPMEILCVERQANRTRRRGSQFGALKRHRSGS